MATKLSSTMIEAAIKGFETQKKEIDVQIAELRAMLTGSKEAPLTEEQPKKKRKLSLAVRKRMKAAQQLRWAKARGESAPPAKKEAVKTVVKASRPKPKFSAEARKALSIAMKKRWAAKKAA